MIFFVSRFLVSFMGFSKEPLPRFIPKEMEKDIARIKGQSKDKEDFAKKSLAFVSGRCKIGAFKCYTEMNKLFWKDIWKIYKEKGYLPCTAQNHLLRTMLVKSKYFKDDDIMLRHTNFDFNIHQYMVLNVDGKEVSLDPWFYPELGYGKHGTGFHLVKSARKIAKK